LVGQSVSSAGEVAARPPKSSPAEAKRIDPARAAIVPRLFMVRSVRAPYGAPELMSSAPNHQFFDLLRMPRSTVKL
jgi:hypothetical protein